MQKTRSEGLSLFLLLLAATYYCHRVYGAFFQMEGDAFFHIYFRLHEKMMWADHNPHQWYFSTLISGVGLLNPVLLFVNFLFTLLPIPVSEITRAVATNMIVAWLSTWLLSVGVYAFLRYAKCSRMASVLGALIVPYTGLHLSGIREFDYVFQSSFMFVGPLLICFLELCKNKNKLRYAAGVSLCVGFSLLGGGNLPMFQYLPFCFFLPVVHWLQDRDSKNLWASYLWLGGAMVAALVIASPAVLPTMNSLQYGNRVEIRFDHIAHSLSPTLKLYSIFLRDWFRVGIIHLHERDYFLGLPVVLLALSGLLSYVRRSPLRSMPLDFWAMSLFLFFCLLITHYCFLPEWIQLPISSLYDRMSMRNSNRFFLLGLLPAAYFAAVGFDRLKGRVSGIVLFTVAMLNLFLIASVLLPDWPALLPDTRIAALLSLSFGFVATGFLWALWMANELGWKPSLRHVIGGAAVTATFGMFLFAPQQLTSYLLNYLNEPAKLRAVSTDRLQWKNIAGFSFNYSDVIEQATAVYHTIPEFLKKPETLTGRILDEAEFKNGGDNRKNLFAPVSGHKFAFTLVRDHLSSKKMQDLANIATPAIYDLNNICWVIPDGKTEAQPRKTCLPEAFFVANYRGFNGAEPLLRWMHGASRDDFQREIAVDCTDTDCRGLRTASLPTPNAATHIIRQKPGAFELKVTSDQSGFVFLSSHYRPDWVAYVNGKERKVFRANHAFMAVPVEAGENQIEFKLVPKLRTYALPFSIAMILILFALTAPKFPVLETKLKRFVPAKNS